MKNIWNYQLEKVVCTSRIKFLCWTLIFITWFLSPEREMVPASASLVIGFYSCQIYQKVPVWFEVLWRIVTIYCNQLSSRKRSRTKDVSVPFLVSWWLNRPFLCCVCSSNWDHSTNFRGKTVTIQESFLKNPQCGPLLLITNGVINPYKWPYKWVTGVITLPVGGFNPFEQNMLVKIGQFPR